MVQMLVRVMRRTLMNWISMSLPMLCLRFTKRSAMDFISMTIFI